MEEPEPVPFLLEPGPTAPCLAVPSLQQQQQQQQQQQKQQAEALQADLRTPPPSSAAAAASVLVDGPCPGPFGWTSAASQDGQLRIFATGPFLDHADQGRPRPLMLAHVLRLVSPGGPGALLRHAWAGPRPQQAGPRQGYQYLATLHRDAVTMHATADPRHPPAPFATLRPCAEARCLDLCVASQDGPADIVGGTAAGAAATAAETIASTEDNGDDCGRGGEVLLVALGGSFGLEVHTVPAAGAAQAPPAPAPSPPVAPKGLLPRASVSLVRFSSDGQWLAVACLDGRVGVLNVASEVLQPAQQQSSSSASSFGHALVVRGERATALAFSRDGRRLAVACADGNVLMLRQRTYGKGGGGGSGGGGWEPCPVFLSPLRALRSAAAASLAAAPALVGGLGGSALPCWPSLAWAPDDRRLAVSLPGNGLCPPEIAVLDAASGACVGSLPLARNAQGAAPCSPPSAAGGCHHLQCIDEAGELRTFRWQMEKPGLGGGRPVLLALTPTEAVWRLGEKQGMPRLLWRRRRRRGQPSERQRQEQEQEQERGWESVVVAAPFLPPDALVPWAESAERVMDGTHGRVVVGAGSLGLLFADLVYVCGWPRGEKEWEEEPQQQPEWRAVGMWGRQQLEQEQGGGGRRQAILLAAAFLEGGRLLAVVAQGDEAWAQSRPLLPAAAGAAARGDQQQRQAPQHARCSLQLPAACQDRRARWTVLSCPSPSSTSDAFVLASIVGPSSDSETGTAALWRGVVHAGGQVVLAAACGNGGPLLQLDLPPPRPGPTPLFLPMDMRVGKGGRREELRFWEVSASSSSRVGVQQCWLLWLGVEADASAEEGEGAETVSWQMTNAKSSAAAGLLCPPPARFNDGISSH